MKNILIKLFLTIILTFSEYGIILGMTILNINNFLILALCIGYTLINIGIIIGGNE